MSENLELDDINPISGKYDNNIENIKKNLKNEEEDEDDDQKFIKKDAESKSSTQIDDICNNMQSDIKKNKDELEGITTKKKKERNLGNEVGGLEKNYEEIKEESNESIEFGAEEAAIDENQALSEEQKAFIYKKKKGKGKGGKKMGQMTLGEKASDSLSYVERLQKLRQEKQDQNKDGTSILR